MPHLDARFPGSRADLTSRKEVKPRKNVSRSGGVAYVRPKKLELGPGLKFAKIAIGISDGSSHSNSSPEESSTSGDIISSIVLFLTPW